MIKQDENGIIWVAFRAIPARASSTGKSTLVADATGSTGILTVNGVDRMVKATGTLYVPEAIVGALPAKVKQPPKKA